MTNKIAEKIEELEKRRGELISFFLGSTDDSQVERVDQQLASVCSQLAILRQALKLGLDTEKVLSELPSLDDMLASMTTAGSSAYQKAQSFFGDMMESLKTVAREKMTGAEVDQEYFHAFEAIQSLLKVKKYDLAQTLINALAVEKNQAFVSKSACGAIDVLLCAGHEQAAYDLFVSQFQEY